MRNNTFVQISYELYNLINYIVKFLYVRCRVLYQCWLKVSAKKVIGEILLTRPYVLYGDYCKSSRLGFFMRKCAIIKFQEFHSATSRFYFVFVVFNVKMFVNSCQLTSFFMGE